MNLILLILLVLLIVGTLPVYPHSTSWGYYPSSALTVILLILLVLAMTGRLNL